MVDPVTEPYLNEAEFAKLYDRVCGSLLHATREPQFAVRHSELMMEIVVWHKKILTLPNEHWITIDEETEIACTMHAAEDGLVHVTLFSAVDGLE